MKKRVLFYCQHVLGMGHLIRSLEIIRSLTDFDVFFLNGGELLPELEWPENITVINLPPLKSDAEFHELKGGEGVGRLVDIQETRRHMLLTEWERLQPDICMIELFPFGRKRFAFELVPLLARNHRAGRPTQVVCSLRDILVDKSDQVRHEAWVCDLMNRYFDVLLVHSDRHFQSLDETFSRVKDLKCQIYYTGFVAQQPGLSVESELAAIPSLPQHTPIIVVSIGGGRVGFELIEGVILASKVLAINLPHRLVVFTGPYIEDNQFLTLHMLVRNHPHISLQRYTSNFLGYLQQASLSISMAGYNTCMNLLSVKCPALVLPFVGRGNQEQTIRARKLEALGILRVLSPQELNPDTLSPIIIEAINGGRDKNTSPIPMDGASKSAAILKSSLSSRILQMDGGQIHQVVDSVSGWQRDLHLVLENMALNDKNIRMFFRDDDVDEDEETLCQLLDLSLSRSLPLNLEIIPGKLTSAGILALKNHCRVNPDLVSLNQHGWVHENHEPEGRKCEFGDNRTVEEQYQDIRQGKELLLDVFGERFFPAFTPPWNRCTSDTLKVLDKLDFRVFSKDRSHQGTVGYGFSEISTTLDLYTWKGGAKMKSPEQIISELMRQLKTYSLIGILLHHKVMNIEAFTFLEQLVNILNRFSCIQIHTFQSMVGCSVPHIGE